MISIINNNNKYYITPSLKNGVVKDGVPSNCYYKHSIKKKNGYKIYYDLIDVSLKPLMKDKRVGIIIYFSTAELLIVEYLSTTPFYGWTTKHFMSYLGYYCNEERGYYHKCCLMKNTDHTYNSGEKCIFYHLHGKRLPQIDNVSYRQYIKEFKEWYEVSYTVPEPSGFQNPDGTYRESFLLDVPDKTEYVFTVFTPITPPPGLVSFKFIKPNGEQVTDMFPVGTLCNMIIPSAPIEMEYSWYVR